LISPKGEVTLPEAGFPVGISKSVIKIGMQSVFLRGRIKQAFGLEQIVWV
jgi:hypothetical protein